MHLSVDSKKPLETLRRDLLAACARAGLVVDAAAGRRPSSPTSPTTFVLELADPLPELSEAGTGPTDGRTWRISGYARGGAGSDGPRSRVSTMRPTELLDLLGHPELSGPALRLERALEQVLKEGAGWSEPPPRP